MNASKMPRVLLSTASQPEEDSYQALLISLLRGLAALQVAAAHLRADLFPGFKTVSDPALWFQALALLTGFAHQAVVLFFLISGWLVGGSLLGKIGRPAALKIYAIDRITRLWTVLIPTFLLIILFGVLGGVLDAHTPSFARANEYSVLSFLGNLLGLQTMSVPSFGGNFVLWSLANETWYYLMFPLLLLCFSARSNARRALAAAALALAASFVTFPILLYFAIWLLGAAFSRVRIECGAWLRAWLLVLFAVVSVYYRFTGINDDMLPASFVQDVNFSIVFLLFLCSMRFRPDPAARLLGPLRKGAAFLSGFSFSLYVVHVPLIGVLGQLGLQWFGRNRLSPANPQDGAAYLGILFCIVGLSYLFYLAFESHTHQVRRLVKNIVFDRPRAGINAPSVPAD